MMADDKNKKKRQSILLSSFYHEVVFVDRYLVLDISGFLPGFVHIDFLNVPGKLGLLVQVNFCLSIEHIHLITYNNADIRMI